MLKVHIGNFISKQDSCSWITSFACLNVYCDKLLSLKPMIVDLLNTLDEIRQWFLLKKISIGQE